ncbi:hypothetical protein JCM9279_003578 [Rhodotorula babjevae]
MATPPAVLSPAARLPVELVEMICNELAVLGRTLDYAGTLRWHRGCRCAALAAAALVSRKWAGPAQTALLRSLHFASPKQCADFLAAMEHTPSLLSRPRAVVFNVMGQYSMEISDNLPFIPVLLEKCHNVEFVCIYAEHNIRSPGFEYAIRNMKHLRTFVFESNPAIGHGGNKWFRVSARHLPAQVRVLSLEDSTADLDIALDMPIDLDLLEYHYLGANTHPVTHALNGLLGSPRPFRISKLNVYVEADQEPKYADGDVERFTAVFAARGVAFKLLTSAWDPTWRTWSG